MAEAEPIECKYLNNGNCGWKAALVKVQPKYGDAIKNELEKKPTGMDPITLRCLRQFGGLDSSECSRYIINTDPISIEGVLMQMEI